MSEKRQKISKVANYQNIIVRNNPAFWSFSKQLIFGLWCNAHDSTQICWQDSWSLLSSCENIVLISFKRIYPPPPGTAFSLIFFYLIIRYMHIPFLEVLFFSFSVFLRTGKMVCHPLPHPVQFMSKYVYFRAMQMCNVTGSMWCKLLLISWCDLWTHLRELFCVKLPMSLS